MISTKTRFGSDTDIIFQKQERIRYQKKHHLIISGLSCLQWCVRVIFVDSESSQSHKLCELESSKFSSCRFRVRVMTWSRRVRVESQELLSHFESLVCKIESISSHTKFHIFSTTFFCYEIAPNML